MNKLSLKKAREKCKIYWRALDVAAATPAIIRLLLLLQQSSSIGYDYLFGFNMTILVLKTTSLLSAFSWMLLIESGKSNTWIIDEYLSLLITVIFYLFHAMVTIYLRFYRVYNETKKLVFTFNAFMTQKNDRIECLVYYYLHKTQFDLIVMFGWLVMLIKWWWFTHSFLEHNILPLHNNFINFPLLLCS